jgi:hypothetical protein
VRACELRAIANQDRVFLSGQYLDRSYKVRRDQAFIIAVNCGQAGGTCFCVSMDAGPKVGAGFDLAVTDLIEEGGHRFVLEVGSAAGADLVKGLAAMPATDGEIEAAEQVVARTKGQMGRHLDTIGLKELLQDNPNHPRWDQVADLACATAERVRRWDSCFSRGFSYIHEPANEFYLIQHGQVALELHALGQPGGEMIEAAWLSIGDLLGCFTPQECANYLAMPVMLQPKRIMFLAAHHSLAYISA